jgi:hypothetical protein
MPVTSAKTYTLHIIKNSYVVSSRYSIRKALLSAILPSTTAKYRRHQAINATAEDISLLQATISFPKRSEGFGQDTYLNDLIPKLGFIVRREKGARIPWEEGSPPGNCCSNRKQPERLGLATDRVEASGGKGSEREPASTQVET